MWFKLLLAILGGLMGSLPWLAHLGPGSMVRHADLAFYRSTLQLSLTFWVGPDMAHRCPRTHQVGMILLTVLVLLLTFPNF